MKDKSIIKKITIEIGGTEAEITPEQALKLYEALGDLLGKPAQVFVEKHVYDRPWYPYWPYPTITWGTNICDGRTTSGGTSWTYLANTNTATLSLT